MQGNGTSPSIHGKHWVGTEFMNRHGLCIRHKTTESQKHPEKLIDKLIVYMLQERRLRIKFSYSDIIAIDKTAVWRDTFSNGTVGYIVHNTITMKKNWSRKDKGFSLLKSESR